jgi:hypothetical protein
MNAAIIGSVDGHTLDNRLSNVGWGAGMGVPITRSLGAKLIYPGTSTQVGTGVNAHTVACAFAFSW